MALRAVAACVVTTGRCRTSQGVHRVMSAPMSYNGTKATPSAPPLQRRIVPPYCYGVRFTSSAEGTTGGTSEGMPTIEPLGGPSTSSMPSPSVGLSVDESSSSSGPSSSSVPSPSNAEATPPPQPPGEDEDPSAEYLDTLTGQAKLDAFVNGPKRRAAIRRISHQVADTNISGYGMIDAGHVGSSWFKIMVGRQRYTHEREYATIDTFVGANWRKIPNAIRVAYIAAACLRERIEVEKNAYDAEVLEDILEGMTLWSLDNTRSDVKPKYEGFDMFCQEMETRVSDALLCTTRNIKAYLRDIWLAMEPAPKERYDEFAVACSTCRIQQRVKDASLLVSLALRKAEIERERKEQQKEAAKRQLAERRAALQKAKAAGKKSQTPPTPPPVVDASPVKTPNASEGKKSRKTSQKESKLKEEPKTTANSKKPKSKPKAPAQVEAETPKKSTKAPLEKRNESKGGISRDKKGSQKVIEEKVEKVEQKLRGSKPAKTAKKEAEVNTAEAKHTRTQKSRKEAKKPAEDEEDEELEEIVTQSPARVKKDAKKSAKHKAAEENDDEGEQDEDTPIPPSRKSRAATSARQTAKKSAKKSPTPPPAAKSQFKTNTEKKKSKPANK